MAVLESLEADTRRMEVRIKTIPGLKEHMALCMAEILGDAPNYTEMKFDLVAPKGDEGFEWVTVTIRRDRGKTPHQLRLEAEEKLVKAQNEITELKLRLSRSEVRRKNLLAQM